MSAVIFHLEVHNIQMRTSEQITEARDENIHEQGLGTYG